MKNAEGTSLPFELDRRLKASIDRLKAARGPMEELVRTADTLGRMLGVEPGRRRGRAAAPSRPAKAGASKGATAQKTPTTKTSRAPVSSTPPPAAPVQEELPEWRKLFPTLSAEVPRRGK